MQVQNSKETTSKNVAGVSGDTQADPAVKLAAKRAKVLIRHDASYTDGAIAVAKRIRGVS